MNFLEIRKRIFSHNFLLISATLFASTFLFCFLIQDNYYNQSLTRLLVIKYNYSVGKFNQLSFASARPELLERRWPNLTLFAPVFPGGEAELNKVLLRSLKFFWPKSNLRLLFLVDGELPPEVRDPFGERIKKSMEAHAISVEVKFNFIPRKVYRGGWDRQQLIMLWADNFTDSEYVGFVDDDALFTKHILREDIFDEFNRPHVWGRSNNSDKFYLKLQEGTRWSDHSDKEIMRTMNYFPVVVKTCHLEVVRASVLKHHPEFRNFDHFYKRSHKRKNKAIGQYNLMHQHLWKLRHDDYNWHLERLSDRDNHFDDIEGVTKEMMVPYPKSAIHINYDYRTNKPKKFVEDVFKRGFCYSLTKLEHESGSKNSQLCKQNGYSWDIVSTTPNIDQWTFEDLDMRWDNRTYEAHKKRLSLNRARLDWDQTELELIFGNANNSIELSL